jgi:thiamine-monophosphate kinase
VARAGLAELAAPLRSHLLRRYRVPEPKVALGLALRGLAHAAIDVSDGLLADLGHICAASGVAADIQVAMVPMSDAVQIALARDPALLARVLAGGDDYEILFTADPGNSDRIAESAMAVGVPVTGIGFIAPPSPDGAPNVRIGDLKAVEAVLRVGGYRHF